MPRIYSNYLQKDYEIITNLSKELGFTPSAFQHYCVMLYANNRGIEIPFTKLLDTLLLNAQNLKSGETFIVSALLPDIWPNLSRSYKMSLAKSLSNHVKSNPAKYKKYKVEKGKATIYLKK